MKSNNPNGVIWEAVGPGYFVRAYSNGRWCGMMMTKDAKIIEGLEPFELNKHIPITGRAIIEPSRTIKDVGEDGESLIHFYGIGVVLRGHHSEQPIGHSSTVVPYSTDNYDDISWEIEGDSFWALSISVGGKQEVEGIINTDDARLSVPGTTFELGDYVPLTGKAIVLYFPKDPLEKIAKVVWRNRGPIKRKITDRAIPALAASRRYPRTSRATPGRR